MSFSIAKNGFVIARNKTGRSVPQCAAKVSIVPAISFQPMDSTPINLRGGCPNSSMRVTVHRMNADYSSARIYTTHTADFPGFNHDCRYGTAIYLLYCLFIYLHLLTFLKFQVGILFRQRRRMWNGSSFYTKWSLISSFLPIISPYFGL